MIFPGILSLISSGRFTSSQLATATSLEATLDSENILDFPYALFLFGCGGVLMFLVCILLTVQALSYRPDHKYLDTIVSEGSTQSQFAQSSTTNQHRQCNESAINSIQPQRLQSGVSNLQTTAILQEDYASGGSAHAPYLPSYDESLAAGFTQQSNI